MIPNFKPNPNRLLILALFGVLGLNSWMSHQQHAGSITLLSDGRVSITTENTSSDLVSLSGCDPNLGSCSVTVSAQSKDKDSKTAATVQKTYTITFATTKVGAHTDWYGKDNAKVPEQDEESATIAENGCGCEIPGGLILKGSKDAATVLRLAAEAITQDIKNKAQKAEQAKLDEAKQKKIDAANKKTQEQIDACAVKEDGENDDGSIKSASMEPDEKLTCMRKKMASMTSESEAQAYWGSKVVPLLNHLMDSKDEGNRSLAMNYLQEFGDFSMPTIQGLALQTAQTFRDVANWQTQIFRLGSQLAAATPQQRKQALAQGGPISQLVSQMMSDPAVAGNDFWRSELNKTLAIAVNNPNSFSGQLGGGIAGNNTDDYSSITSLTAAYNAGMSAALNMPGMQNNTGGFRNPRTGQIVTGVPLPSQYAALNSGNNLFGNSNPIYGNSCAMQGLNCQSTNFLNM